jgi:hypothetical protein
MWFGSNRGGIVTFFDQCQSGTWAREALSLSLGLSSGSLSGSSWWSLAATLG